MIISNKQSILKPLKIAVLITCHNRRIKTIACLEAIVKNVIPKHLSLQIILVDDGSTDGTEGEVKKSYPFVEILNGDGSLYWNKAMHWAFSHAMKRGYDAYLWLNDDTELYPSAIQSLTTTWLLQYQSGEGLGIVVGSTQDPHFGSHTYGGVVSNSFFRPFHYTLVKPQSFPVECHTMNGNCVLVPHEIASVVGNIDPRFSHSMGDTDYGLRAKMKGFKIWLSPGYVGKCSRNPSGGTFKDTSLSRLERWRKIISRKGLPLSSWYAFTRRHGGVLWFLYFCWPYLSIWLRKRVHS